MKKIWDRVLAYMLTFAMCASMVNVPVYAQENTVTEVMMDSEVVTEEIADTDNATMDGEDDNTWDKLTTENIYEGKGFKITYTLSSYWNTGYNANIKIENIGDSSMENWYLKFNSQNKRGFWHNGGSPAP